MADAPAELTWDISPPRRPSLSDLGNAAIQDHASKPPDKATMPYADQLNQWAKQLERLAAMIEGVGLSITFAAGTPSVSQFVAMRTTTVIGDFTVTDNGAGDTTITWPANTFPPSVLGPIVSINSDSDALAPRAFLVANGVRVKTKDSAGVAADLNFTVLWR